MLDESPLGILVAYPYHTSSPSAASKGLQNLIGKRAETDREVQPLLHDISTHVGGADLRLMGDRRVAISSQNASYKHKY